MMTHLVIQVIAAVGVLVGCPRRGRSSGRSCCCRCHRRRRMCPTTSQRCPLLTGQLGELLRRKVGGQLPSANVLNVNVHRLGVVEAAIGRRGDDWEKGEKKMC